MDGLTPRDIEYAKQRQGLRLWIPLNSEEVSNRLVDFSSDSSESSQELSLSTMAMGMTNEELFCKMKELMEEYCRRTEQQMRLIDKRSVEVIEDNKRSSDQCIKIIEKKYN